MSVKAEELIQELNFLLESSQHVGTDNNIIYTHEADMSLPFHYGKVGSAGCDLGRTCGTPCRTQRRKILWNRRKFIRERNHFVGYAHCMRGSS